MPLTRWEMLQAMAAVMLMGVLAVLVGILLVRLAAPVARRSALFRGCLKALGWFLLGCGGLTLLVCIASLFEVATLEVWGLSVLGLIVGGGFYLWGRLVWRFKGEKPIGPRCRKCGYDLTGLDLDVKPPPPCPECGRVVSDPRKNLFRVPTRKWATRLGVVIVVVGVVGPLAERVYRRGWASMVPNEVLLRLMVMNVSHDAARAELGQRNVYLYNMDPHWTRDIMVAFADEYDAAVVTSAGGTMPWTIFNRFYALYQGSKDAETLALAESWLSSPSVGKRITASGMMTTEGFCPKEDRLRLLRPLLSDPDMTVQTHALRALTFDAALPLDELLAFVNAPHPGLWAGEMNAALTHYNDPESRAARLRLAADTSNSWADLVTWSLLFEAFDFNKGKVVPGAIRTLAAAKVVVPKARTAWTRNAGFRIVYAGLIDAAVARAGTDGEDAQTAAWCRAALVSYATTAPMAVPGAPASLVPAILLGLDAQLAVESDPVIKGRLLDLRKAISSGTLIEGESVPGDSTKTP